MVFSQVWIGPVIISAYGLGCLLICFCLSAYYHHLPPRWPYLSEIATHAPESNVYSMMTNHIAVMVCIWVYVKHRLLVSYFSLEGNLSSLRLLSLINMLIGVLGAVALQMTANFPKTQVPYVQTTSSLIVVLCTVIYIWVHTVFSYFVVDPHVPRTSLLLIRMSLAAAVTSCTASIPVLKVFEIRGHNFDKTTPSPLDTSNGAAIFEWAVYFSICLFLLTDACEFRNLTFKPPKLVIPGSPLYDELRMRDPTSSLSAPQRRREMSFTDLPTESMTVPLVR